jgi:hypothetical protein
MTLIGSEFDHLCIPGVTRASLAWAFPVSRMVFDANGMG